MKYSLGKRVGGVTYVHRSALALMEGEARSAISHAEACVGVFEWNVVRVAKGSVSLLRYESFDNAAFPALLASAKIDILSGNVSRSDYQHRSNPPILHRKELLLPPDDPRLPAFRALTAAAEGHGLFRDSNKIGTRKNWDERIAEAGLVLRGHRLVAADEEHVEVARHRTAILRRDLSQPMQLLIRFGVVTSNRTVFDYGCGQGEDVAALASRGFEAFGWDPHHASDGPRRPADVVNLGFVLNVIEDPRERFETLKSAWDFAKRSLCIAVMLQGKSSIAGHKPYRDGFLSSRGTFQKYFDQQELQTLVAGATGQQPLAFAPGIVAVFKDKDLEQEVHLRRHSRAFVGGEMPRPPYRERLIVARPELRERIAPAIDTLRIHAIRLGRLPETVLPKLSPRLRVLVGSAEVLQGGVEASDFVEIDLEAPRIVMITCDDIDRFVPFIIERTQVDLGRLKVSTDRRDSETMPVYFKSRFMPADDPGRDGQLAFEATMASTGLFVPGAPDPLWATIKPFLANLVSDI